MRDKEQVSVQHLFLFTRSLSPKEEKGERRAVRVDPVLYMRVYASV